jgi:hypothetical protein
MLGKYANVCLQMGSWRPLADNTRTVSSVARICRAFAPLESDSVERTHDRLLCGRNSADKRRVIHPRWCVEDWYCLH